MVKEEPGFKGRQPVDKTVYIDVGAKKIDANVSRDGVPIGKFEVDEQTLGLFIQTRGDQELRVVKQSPKAGTAVPVGTAVNLALVPAGKVPIGVISGTLEQLKPEEIGLAYGKYVGGDIATVKGVLTRAAAGKLTPADEQAVKSLFVGKGVDIGTTYGKDLAAAIETLRVLVTFGG